MCAYSLPYKDAVMQIYLVQGSNICNGNGSNNVLGGDWFCYLLVTEGPLVVIPSLLSAKAELLSDMKSKSKREYTKKRTVRERAAHILGLLVKNMTDIYLLI